MQPQSKNQRYPRGTLLGGLLSRLREAVAKQIAVNDTPAISPSGGCA